MDLISELRQRGLIEQITDEDGIRELLKEKASPIYIGFDPTAKSLHVGSMVPMIVLAHFQRAGHRPIAVVGGATGMIGDPSGRSAERNLITTDHVAENLAGIRQQLQSFLDFEGDSPATLVNNADWTAPMSFLDMLRDVGKYLTVNYMMAKESVRRRLEDRDQGISYTEFSYMILQAYDFLHLYRAEGCRLQGGGNDQWGNITAGIDLIHKAEAKQAYGLTFPLITTASGEKFGKSAGNAVWLDPEMTSPYEFYQYWLQTADADLERCLKIFTFLPLNTIQAIVSQHSESPEQRYGQRCLAEAMTEMLHGTAEVNKAKLASEVLFGSEIKGLSDRDLAAIFADVPSSEMPQTELGALKLMDLLRESGLAKSNGEARRLIQGGGIYLNNLKCDDPFQEITRAELASETTLVLRSGKKKYHLIRFI